MIKNFFFYGCFLFLMSISAISCRNEIGFIESENMQSTKQFQNKISFKTFKSETKINNSDKNFLSQSISSKSKNAQIDTDFLNTFRIDTININKLNFNKLNSYAFRVYNLFENPDRKYNLVYFYRNDRWNFSILELLENSKTKPIYDSRSGILKLVENRSTSRMCEVAYTSYTYHCTQTGSCASGICDGCNLCVDENTSHVFVECGGSDGDGDGFPNTGDETGDGSGNYNLSDPSGYVFDPNIQPSIDPAYVRASRAYSFWIQLNEQQWASENPSIYINLLENYLDNYTVPSNSKNLEFANWTLLKLSSDINFRNNFSNLDYSEIQNYFSINNEINKSLFNEEYISETNEAFVAFGANADIENLTDAQITNVLNLNCCAGLFATQFAVEKTKLIVRNYLFNRKFYPEWSKSKCLWESSRETIQLMLDLGGLVPVIGEVCDITNGVIYTIQGDGINASLSYASAIPIAGWFAAGSKLGIKVVNKTASNIASRQLLKWIVGTDGVVKFGYSSQLTKVLQLTDAAKQAHHLIPWALANNSIIQKASKSANAFHLNEALNGIAVTSWRNQPNHNIYNSRILNKLNALPSNLTADQAYIKLMEIITQAKQAVINNPNTHLNNLVF
ncbi:AHH domain-containing protein [Halpernia frigidisoli]|uniref:A nuclease family of the HNH/ENDO VII superfamily with conserved AHH n=1 Tax=Halpernia frigidisoli TaxID=1125876 RepID=A0A1I3HGJ3_9FLAO|nr:AHH domain-containing protein [Halpernia frigidisoli]SFI34729.1 A nuclease family of the HNH/ENDO VII superfamily with conserved AHH [Halpernia frigidisoli]